MHDTETLDSQRVEIAKLACSVVAQELMERHVMSCVYGARLLARLLADAGVPCAAVGVMLEVWEPWVSDDRRQYVMHIGAVDLDAISDANDGALIETSNGFAGHVVIIADVGSRSLLLDPTAFQASRGTWSDSRTPPATSVVVFIDPAPDRLTLCSEVQGMSDGWGYVYRPDPNVADWTARREWSGRDRYGLEPVVRRRLANAANIVLEAPQQVRRNDPCPCGSGLKSKKCCHR